jgi:outer membrane protein assembly factor BamA
MLRQLKGLRLLASVLAVAMATTDADGQQADAEGGRPRVDRIVFEGRDALDEAELRASIVTRETRCIGFVVRPLCWLTDWALLHDVHHLDREELRADELRLRIRYFQRGFRRARVASEVQRRGSGVEVRFRIEEGPATSISALEVRQLTDALSGGQIARAGLPREGRPLDLLRIEHALRELHARLGDRGYLDGVVRDSIALATDTLSARVSIIIDPGRRSTLDTLDIEGNEDVDDRTIGDALRLREGRVLRTRDLVGAQRSLYESNLFHEARVRVPEQPDSAKRVHIAVREAPPRAARVGGGFNTIEFGQIEGRFTHYNFFGRNRRIELRGAVGNLLASSLNSRSIFRDVLPPDAAPGEVEPFLKPTWQVSTEFRQPAFRSAANVLGISAFAHRRTIPGIAIDESLGAELSLTRRFDFRTPATLAYRFEMTAVDAGDLYFCVNYGICEPGTIETLQTRHNLAPLSASFFHDRANDPIAATQGTRLRLDVEHASDVTLSDFGYHRVSGEAMHYRPLDVLRRRVLAGRVRAGWVHPLTGLGAIANGGVAEEIRILHPRKRFYAGGARSVRGYRENQLGPRILTVSPEVLTGENGGCTDAELADGTCDPANVPVEDLLPRPVGGTSVLEASVEYRFPLRGSLQGAVFVDGGVVGEGLRGLFTDGIRAVTPGFGARMASPVGPIRLDLGIRPRLVEQLQVVTELVDENGERRLVRLDTPRRYDPLDDSGGFLRQVLSRLVLHLSIGEAF